jgi:hypothetical protein
VVNLIDLFLGAGHRPGGSFSDDESDDNDDSGEIISFGSSDGNQMTKTSIDNTDDASDESLIESDGDDENDF